MCFKLDELLPQKSPMILLSEIIEYDFKNRSIISTVSISSESMFFDEKINGVPSYIGLEYMAQTVGCLIGIENAKPPKFELILGTKNFEIFVQKFEKEIAYNIFVQEQFSIGEMSSFYGEIFDDQKFTCAKGDIKIYHGNEIKQLVG